MRTTAHLTILVASLALAACGSGEEAEMPMDTEDLPMTGGDMPMDAENMPMESGDMPMMGPDAEMQMANAEGTVTAIDNGTGTITIQHGPVPAVDWPAMTMAFEADEAAREQVAVGDDVSSNFRMSDSGSEVVSIRKN